MNKASGKARKFRSGTRKKEVGLVLDMYAELVSVRTTRTENIEIDVFAASLEKARQHSANQHAAQMQESCTGTDEQGSHDGAL